jgi:phospholipid-transporting ATPase
MTTVLDLKTRLWEDKKWKYLAAGDIIQLKCDMEAPADILILASSNKSGIVYVDTMNLDGENNLKERMVLLENLDEKKLNYV